MIKIRNDKNRFNCSRLKKEQKSFLKPIKLLNKPFSAAAKKTYYCLHLLKTTWFLQQNHFQNKVKNKIQ